MLSLQNIVKNYVTGDTTVEALKGVTLNFRKSEFVSILGPSGCGKTTMLNIIGGFDRYTDGDLIIKGRSTKQFTDRDWDSYRNHSVGFVFQSYNLIPHQSVLSNVELALTLSGVSKAERKKRAAEALEKVGLGDQLNKKPTQMSGGQMQRVAIARALVNDPEILLADEPTGALDSVTSIQIMDLLAEIAKDRLVIMVTHNPEIAEKYSSRIIKLHDGLIIDDSNPCDEIMQAPVKTEDKKDEKKDLKKHRKENRTSMSFWTAFSLSMNNLLTKKARTFLVSFAGSIGIIGIALILALSNGIQLYIDKVQQDTLSSYPLVIESQTVDYTSLMTSMMGTVSESQQHDLDKVYSNTIMFDMMNVMISEVQTNNLSDFKKYLDSMDDELRESYVNDIKYSYNLNLPIYSADTEEKVTKLGMDVFYQMMYSDMGGGMSDSMDSMSSMSTGSFNLFSEMLDNDEVIDSQYNVIAGRMPESYDEVVLVVNSNNEISDMALYALGLKDQSELMKIMNAVMAGETFEVEPTVFSYEEVLNMTFKLVLPSDLYTKNTDGTWSAVEQSSEKMKEIVNNAMDLKIVGIIRPDEEAVSSSISGTIAYTSELTKYIVNETNKSELITTQKANPDTDIITGLPFATGNEVELTAPEKAVAITGYFSELSAIDKASMLQKIMTTPSDEMVQTEIMTRLSAISMDQMKAMLVAAMIEQGLDEATAQAYLSQMTDEQITQTIAQSMVESVTQELTEQLASRFAGMTTEELATLFDSHVASLDEAVLATLYDTYMPASYSESSYEANLEAFGSVDLDNPSAINIYAKDFDSKEYVSDLISKYNEDVDDKDKITYTDYVALLMSSVSTIVNFVSYALIAFVSISLIVSSIMIGIITYISVLERTKEIGILRAMGASKHDVSMVFNAETLIVGLAAGIIGILASLIICIPVNLIINSLTGIATIAVLPWAGALILIALSIILTLIAGLIPSRLAAKKDPVIALRSE